MSVLSANPLMMKPAPAAGGGGDVVTKSLRFNDGDTPSLSRTYTSSATWTFSVWVKRGELGATNNLLGTVVQFNASDQLVTPSLTTTAKYRDVGAWYHICVSNSGLYVNGVQVTGTVSTAALSNAKVGDSFDGYLASVTFIDGTALAASSFAEEDATTGQWKPKAYTGSYGSNGFHLDFEDSTAIGNDVSGNNNDFTATHAASDVMEDTPTQNYCTLSPIDTQSAQTFSEGNLKVSYSGGAYTAGGRSTFAIPSTGGWYWEATCTAVAQSYIGILGLDVPIVGTATNVIYSSTSFYAYKMDGNKWNNGASSYGASFTTNDVIGVALSGSGDLTFYKNGTTQGTAFTGLTPENFSPAYIVYSGAAWLFNFGQSDFAYTPPTGFSALSTANLPTPTIVKPKAHFDVLTYAGSGAKTFDNGSTSMQPDLVWVKSRGSALAHKLTDSVRGTTKSIESNSTNAEATESTGLTAFGTDGFTVGADGDYSASSMAAWAWKKSATAGMDIVTWTGNDDGLGPPAPQSVSHSLGASPDFIVAKQRTANGMGNGSWVVWHKDLTSGKYLLLNTTAGEASWSNALVSSIDATDVSFGSDGWGSGEDLNADSMGGADTYVAYLFATVAGYSKVGLYNGNSSDNFVALDFAPAWILIKATGNPSSSGHWVIKDNKRSAAYNPADGNLYANDTYAEDTTASVDIDLLSNGFSIQGTYAGINASTSSYIYAAFAEAPLKYANAR